VREPGKPEYWIDELIFDDDPRTAAVRGKNGFAVMKLQKRNGVWIGSRNLVLPR
jgi:hypothetical protein